MSTSSIVALAASVLLRYRVKNRQTDKQINTAEHPTHATAVGEVN